MGNHVPSFRAMVGDKFANVADVYIDGKIYEYRPKYGDAESYCIKANCIAIHSPGKAIVFIKEHGDYIGKVPCPH